MRITPMQESLAAKWLGGFCCKDIFHSDVDNEGL